MLEKTPIITSYITKNPFYKRGRTISVKGLVLHSIGVGQPDPLVLINNYNRETYNSVAVHGFIGADASYITLPCLETPKVAWHCWHVGSGKNGSLNNTHIGIELCEPAQIRYTGGATFTCTDTAAAIEYVEKTIHNAVELFAKLCKFHGLNPLENGVIVSHDEARRLGVGSGHVDPEHLWKGLGMDYNMNKFRQEVFEEMLTIEEDEDMTTERFKQLWYEMRAELQDNDAAVWSQEARDWAVNSGLITGTSDGEFNGAWEDLLTREQLVTVLYRFAKMMGKV